jgi:hypothetical protein
LFNKFSDLARHTASDFCLDRLNGWQVSGIAELGCHVFAREGMQGVLDGPMITASSQGVGEGDAVPNAGGAA